MDRSPRLLTVAEAAFSVLLRMLRPPSLRVSPEARSRGPGPDLGPDRGCRSPHRPRARQSGAWTAQTCLSWRAPPYGHTSRHTPSRVMPSLSATAALRPLSAWQCHSARCSPRAVKAQSSSRPQARVIRPQPAVSPACPCAPSRPNSVRPRACSRTTSPPSAPCSNTPTACWNNAPSPAPPPCGPGPGRPQGRRALRPRPGHRLRPQVRPGPREAAETDSRRAGGPAPLAEGAQSFVLGLVVQALFDPSGFPPERYVELLDG